jgi:4-diphosphocytidyl-2-C-methyl-D-erythritol kinase
MKLLAPAKINLFLEVENKRPDGYHNINTVFQTVSLFDTIILKKRKSGLLLKCDNPDIPCDDRNLAIKAALALQKELNFTGGAEITIKKQIPVGAGLGGGSSDAAAVLSGLLKLWKKEMPLKRLTKVAARLGADVPFFLHKGTARATGIGDRIKRINGVEPSWYVLVYPGFGVPTAKVYKSLVLPLTRKKLINKIKHQLRYSSLLKGGFIFNRLEDAVLPRYPEIRKVKTVLKSMGIHCMMSGSGSTVFGVVDSQRAGELVRAKLKDRPWSVWVVKSVG